MAITSTTLVTHLSDLAIAGLDEHGDDLDTAVGAIVDQFCLNLGGYADIEARTALTTRVAAAIRDDMRIQIGPSEHDNARTMTAAG